MGLFHRSSSSSAPARATPAVAADDHSPSPLKAGEAGRCPQCGGFGYLDHIDMVNRFQTQHCPSCTHSWEFDFDEHGDAVIDLTASAETRNGSVPS